MEPPDGFTLMDRYEFALFVHGNVGDFAQARASGFFKPWEIIRRNGRSHYVANSALDRMAERMKITNSPWKCSEERLEYIKKRWEKRNQ